MKPNDHEIEGAGTEFGRQQKPLFDAPSKLPRNQRRKLGSDKPESHLNPAQIKKQAKRRSEKIKIRLLEFWKENGI